LISSESRVFKTISNILHDHKKEYAPKFLDFTFFDKTYVIIMEFISHSIEEAIKEKYCSYKDIMLGMFDAI
jgi:hypothetical protein